MNISQVLFFEQEVVSFNFLSDLREGVCSILLSKLSNSASLSIVSVEVRSVNLGVS